MKNFVKLCKMTQNGIKEYMEAYLKCHGYQPINENGFLYAKGTIPVLLVAHMDTVHKETCKKIVNKKGKLSSPQGIGGDDRCGVYIIAEIVKELHCSVLLCENEEIGCIGAKLFTETKYVKELGVNYMVEFDRKGNNDAVYYSCDNKEFKEFVESATAFKEAPGSYSDISKLMPAAHLAAVNLSSGYYNPHTIDEFVVFDEMRDIIDEAKNLITTECEHPFEYVEKKYTKSTNYYWDNEFDQCSLFGKRKTPNNYDVDALLELEVIFTNSNMEEEVDLCYGQTKAECWYKFFLEHSDVCMNDVYDYSYT